MPANLSAKQNEVGYSDRLLVFGELLMKEIQHDHGEILGRIESTRTTLANFEKLSKDELFAKRI